MGAAAESRAMDPRPARTRARLFAALLELIQEQRWERITVRQILERAEVGRSTFYAHFDNKFDLLVAEIPSLTVTIAESDGQPDLLPLFVHVEEMGPVIRPLMRQPLLGEIMDTFQRRLAVAWYEHLADADLTESRRILVAEMLAGGLLSVARRWLADGCAPPATEIAAVCAADVRAVISSASSAGA